MSFLTFFVVTGLGGFAPASAQLQFLPTPPDQGAPTGRQRGGATRGDCLAYQDLRALVPEIDGVVWSQTASDTPSFFFEVPTAITTETPLEFVIQDSNDDYAVRKRFSIDTVAGIIEIPVAKGETSLIPGQNYSWTLSIYCDAARPSASVSVSGTLQRVADFSTATTIPEMTPEEQIERIQQYATEGIWHEATVLALVLHQTAPNNADYLETLESLFGQAGFVDLSLSAPIFTL
ncbi:MAG: DUF928 domain-containing protein [Cyanobacteria bacterium J06621_11]